MKRRLIASAERRYTVAATPKATQSRNVEVTM